MRLGTARESDLMSPYAWDSFIVRKDLGNFFLHYIFGLGKHVSVLLHMQSNCCKLQFI